VAAGDEPLPARGEPALADDRANVLPGEPVVLIVEDNRDFAQWLLDLAHDHGFKAVVTGRGQRALELVREFAPTAITLDLSLPDINGWQILDRLKSDLITRHIPVFVISANQEPENALKLGALRFLTKPIDAEQIVEIFAKARALATPGPKKLLLIEDDETQRQSIRELIGNDSAHLTDAADGSAALAALAQESFDCVVLDLMLPDMSGFDLIDRIRSQHEHLPIIVYTAKDLSPEEEERLNRIAQTTIVKDVRSPERLYDQTALWLHRDATTLPEDKREMLRRLHDPDEILSGRKVLIVDDDIRNIFAMTSMLERYKMDVVSAETGKAAIELLGTEENIDLVLMDIMLPEMDGYDTMRAIRSMFGFEQLPIIALTAKAMKGDREKCIDAGASDYISKPVDTERLLTLLRNWLHR
jgi:CheY-like chemotaxis protein